MIRAEVNTIRPSFAMRLLIADLRMSRAPMRIGTVASGAPNSGDEMMSDLVVSDEGPIRTLRMYRPGKKNALTLPMYETMATTIEEAATNGGIRCLLIAGGPEAFCAGHDIGDFMQAASKDGALSPTILRFLHSLVCCEKPLVAAVAGVAIGVGTTMLLHCDHVVAAATARFSTPFVALGLVPEAASSLIAPRRWVTQMRFHSS